LALQGGGSHGAFTWGVLDRMLQEPSIEIIGVTGTSAGAMNAVVLADGLLRGGPAEARQRLRQFWERIGSLPGFGSLLWPLSGEHAAAVHIDKMPHFVAWDALSRNLSPYDLNPGNLNPPARPLEELVDFDRLRAQTRIRIVVCATSVRAAVRRTFSNTDISVDAVLASACLPDLFPAVEIDGEAYWDGGYTGNPAMSPLVRALPDCDLIIIRIDPIMRQDLPRSVREIHDRVLEISFNAASWTELATIGMLLKFTDEGLLPRERFGRFRFHAIEANNQLEELPSSSKLNNYPAFLEFLHDNGMRTADAWLANHRAALGKRSTVDLQALLQTSVWDAS
jgi:NTE family protein